MKRYWTLLLLLWTVLLSAWTVLCHDSAAGAAGLWERREDDSFVQLKIPCIDQREKWPTGCESVSAVMALRYAGVEITVDEFIDRYLPLGDPVHDDGTGAMTACDPRTAFPGDPRSDEGWGCFVPAVFNAMETLLRERDVPLRPRDLTGSTLEELCDEYIAQGTPVLVWATIGMAEPQPGTVFTIEETGELYRWISPMHCLLLVGRNRNGYCFNDPMTGEATTYSEAAVQRAYKAMGCQALALIPKN